MYHLHCCYEKHVISKKLRNIYDWKRLTIKNYSKYNIIQVNSGNVDFVKTWIDLDKNKADGVLEWKLVKF